MSETLEALTRVSGDRIRVTQTGSGNGQKPGQQATLIGLGLNKISKSREFVATPEILGMPGQRQAFADGGVRRTPGDHGRLVEHGEPQHRLLLG